MIFSFYCMQNPASDRKMIKQEYGLFLNKLISFAISLDNLTHPQLAATLQLSARRLDTDD